MATLNLKRTSSHRQSKISEPINTNLKVANMSRDKKWIITQKLIWKVLHTKINYLDVDGLAVPAVALICLLALTLTFETLEANLSELILSVKQSSKGAILTSIKVLELPLRLGMSRYVNFESLKGICSACKGTKRSY